MRVRTLLLVRYTIGRYIEQHSLPFRRGLTEKRFNGHVARIAEGMKFKFKRVENHCACKTLAADLSKTN